MIRIKRGQVARRLRQKSLKLSIGFSRPATNLFKTAHQKNIKSQIYSYQGRRKFKGQNRKQWITRINSASRMNQFSFNKLIHYFRKSNYQLNRKILSQLVIYDPKVFFSLLDNLSQYKIS